MKIKMAGKVNETGEVLEGTRFQGVKDSRVQVSKFQMVKSQISKGVQGDKFSRGQGFKSSSKQIPNGQITNFKGCSRGQVGSVSKVGEEFSLK